MEGIKELVEKIKKLFNDYSAHFENTTVLIIPIDKIKDKYSYNYSWDNAKSIGEKSTIYYVVNIEEDGKFNVIEVPYRKYEHIISGEIVDNDYDENENVGKYINENTIAVIGFETDFEDTNGSIISSNYSAIVYIL